MNKWRQNWDIKVIIGEGGGGYHFYELAPSLLVKETTRLPIYQINPSYTFRCSARQSVRLKDSAINRRMCSTVILRRKRFIHITTEFINAGYNKIAVSALAEGQSL